MKLKLFLFFFVLVSAMQLHAQTGFPFDNEIRAFKQQDSLSFPKPNGILFIGSSSIRLWSDLEQRFAGKPIIKRGVGGSELWQLVDYYTPYILFPYHPRKIFIYSGENDIAGGKTPQFVADEFTKLWKMLHKKLPNAEIYYLSIKLSPVRAKYYADDRLANRMIKAYINGKPHTHFVELNRVIFNPKTGTPDSSLFKPDYLHLNNKGYDRWEKVLKPFMN
ncbi:SGNH/GDSL hydrolase family protein [soil metagenome]|jgi:hypothetical protein